MTATVPASNAADRTHQAQRRVLGVLVTAQVFSGAGLVAGLTVGALLVEHMLGSESLAGLPGALYTAGSALAAVGISRISQAHGRRPGLAVGYAFGALGSAGVVVAAVLSSPTLLFVSLFIYGAGTATNLQSRYAGADLAEPDHRGRAVSTVLVATTLGGVIGPNLASPAGHLAHGFGVPFLAGPFLLACAAYILATLILAAGLRPDPLLLARELAASGDHAEPHIASEHDELGGLTSDEPVISISEAPPPDVRRAGLALGVLTMILAQFVMIAVSTITPLEMHDHGHGTGAVGLVIAVHVAFMYLPSPLTGWLVDRYGSTTMAGAAAITFFASAVATSLAPPESVSMLTFALTLLGLAWNFGLVSGTALITETVPLVTRAKTQGMVDLSIAIAGASGGLSAGVAVGFAGFPAFALGGGVIALGIVPAIIFIARIR